jgi:hypothetical protein
MFGENIIQQLLYRALILNTQGAESWETFMAVGATGSMGGFSV